MFSARINIDVPDNVNFKQVLSPLVQNENSIGF